LYRIHDGESLAGEQLERDEHDDRSMARTSTTAALLAANEDTYEALQ
jgi:hypothetical protein